MSNPFAEDRLNLGIHYQTTGGPQFNTSILVQGSGAEQRSTNWKLPLSKWSLGERYLNRSEWEYLRAFFWARQGALVGFRFRDWSDYRVNNSIYQANGALSQFQIIKHYGTGPDTLYRPIQKPIASGAKVYLNGILQSGYSIDEATGIIVFSSPPTSGVLISVDLEFDTPVRFEQDLMDVRFDASRPEDGEGLFYLSTLSVVEVRL